MKYKRAWLFCRGSTAQSIWNQKQELLAHCRKMKWEPVKCTTILGSIKDYSDILATHQDEKIDMLLATHASVLGRNTLPVIAFIAELGKRGIQVDTIAEGHISLIPKTFIKMLDETSEIFAGKERKFASELEEADYDENFNYNDISL